MRYGSAIGGREGGISDSTRSVGPIDRPGPRGHCPGWRRGAALRRTADRSGAADGGERAGADRAAGVEARHERAGPDGSEGVADGGEGAGADRAAGVEARHERAGPDGSEGVADGGERAGEAVQHVAQTVTSAPAQTVRQVAQTVATAPAQTVTQVAQTVATAPAQVTRA